MRTCAGAPLPNSPLGRKMYAPLAGADVLLGGGPFSSLELYHTCGCGP